MDQRSHTDEKGARRRLSLNTAYLGEGPSLYVVQDPFTGNLHPATGMPLDPVLFASEQEVTWAVERARRAQGSWQALTPQKRARFIALWVELLIEHRDEIIRAIMQETGRDYTDILGSEFSDLRAFSHSAIRSFLHHQKPRRLAQWRNWFKHRRVKVRLEPRGVVGVIGNWNQPLVTLYRSALPALLCGNTLVCKPSEYAPRTAQILQRLAERVLPENIFCLALGGPAAADSLFKAGVDAVAFSGAVATGRRIYRAAARYSIPCALDLKGRDAAIVLDDCDLERTVLGIAQYTLANGGRVHTSIDQVIVHENIADEFARKLVQLAESLNQKAQQQGGRLTPLQSPGQLNRMLSYIEAAIAQGAILRCGGRRVGPGFNLEPTVVDHCTPKMAIVQEEALGPLVCLMRVKNEAEAIELVGDNPYALGVSVWTSDLAKGERICQSLKPSLCLVNSHSRPDDLAEIPWTGMEGVSGLNLNYQSGWEAFSRLKTFVVDADPRPALLWMPKDDDLRAVIEGDLSTGGQKIWQRLRQKFVMKRRRKSLAGLYRETNGN